MTHLTIIGIKRIHIQKSKSSIKTPLPHFITFGFPYGKRISRSRDPNTYTHRHTHRQLRSYNHNCENNNINKYVFIGSLGK